MTFATAINMSNITSKRSLARLAAVQAMYQQSMSSDGSDEIVGQFQQHRFDDKSEEISLENVDRELFTDLVHGSNTRLADIDKMIEANLAEGWSLSRVDAVLTAILRCAVYELWCRTDIPPKVTINEYVTLTADFYEGKEPGFINGVLDKVAKQLRPTAVK